MSEMGERIHVTFNSASMGDYSAVDRLKDAYAAMRPYSDDELAGIASFDDAFEVRFVYNSNSIEGSTLTLGETALVLDGEFVPGKPGRDHFAARGSADGMAYYKKALAAGEPLSENLILNIHERTALDCQPATRGVYRRHPVYIRGSRTVPANWAVVPDLMADLISHYLKSTQHDIYKATAFHAMFENVHPFADGNGRTGRLVLNYMLEATGYPPIAINADARAAYLEALEDWQVRSDTEPLIALVSDAIAAELTDRTACVLDARHPHS